MLDEQEIDQWIRDMSDLRRNRPPPTVQYRNPMPSIDSLMQVQLDWNRPPSTVQYRNLMQSIDSFMQQGTVYSLGLSVQLHGSTVSSLPLDKNNCILLRVM